MKGFYKKLKGWKKFWFWVVLSVILINFFQLVDYTVVKTRWNYTKNNEDISLLTKVVFPAPSIIFESKKIGFMFDIFIPIVKKDHSLKKINNFSGYWKSKKMSGDWFCNICAVLIFYCFIFCGIIIEWFYFLFWQILIKCFLWEFLLRDILWGVVIKDFIWGVLLSGWWLK